MTCVTIVTTPVIYVYGKPELRDVVTAMVQEAWRGAIVLPEGSGIPTAAALTHECRHNGIPSLVILTNDDLGDQRAMDIMLELQQVERELGQRIPTILMTSEVTEPTARLRGLRTMPKALTVEELRYHLGEALAEFGE